MPKCRCFQMICSWLCSESPALNFSLSAVFHFNLPVWHLLLDVQPTQNMFLTEFIFFLLKFILSTRFSISAYPFHNHLRGQKLVVWITPIENGIAVHKYPTLISYWRTVPCLTHRLWPWSGDVFWWKGCQQIWHTPHSLRSTAHFCWLSASSSLTIPSQGLPLQPGSRNEKTKRSQATPGKSQSWHVL